MDIRISKLSTAHKLSGLFLAVMAIASIVSGIIVHADTPCPAGQSIAFINPALLGTTHTSTFVASTWTGGPKISFFPFHTGDQEVIPVHANFMGVTDGNVYFGGGSTQVNLTAFGAVYTTHLRSEFEPVRGLPLRPF